MYTVRDLHTGNNSNNNNNNNNDCTLQQLQTVDKYSDRQSDTRALD